MPLNFSGLKFFRREKSSSNASTDSSVSSMYFFSGRESYSTSSIQNFQISDPVPLIDIEVQQKAEGIIATDPRLARARAESITEIPGLSRARSEGLAEAIASRNSTIKPPLIRRPLSDITNANLTNGSDFKKTLEFRTVKVLEELDYAREMKSWRKENWATKFRFPEPKKVDNKEKLEKLDVWKDNKDTE